MTRPPLQLEILQQPQDIQAEIGENFAITVKAQGEGLTYQWYYKESYMQDFAISCNQTPSYAYTMQEYRHNRQVYCVITDKYGNSIQSETATMTRPPLQLEILQQPQDVQAEIGENFAITVEAQGEGLTYQWYYKESYMQDFAISCNQTSSYAYTMQEYRHKRQVYCVITDKYGNSVQSETVTITLPPL